MGIIDNKRNIFTEIGAFTSIKDNLNLPQSKSSISSINNSKEIVPYLLDLLVVLVGGTRLSTLIGELMTDFIRNIEPKLKSELKKQLINFNSNDNLPTYFINDGITIAVPLIDIVEKLKTDPTSQIGGLLYNTVTENFDSKLYDAIVSDGGLILFNNLEIKFNNSSNSFTFKPTTSSQEIGEFINEYIDGIEIINEKEFSVNILDTIFGTVSTKENKSEKQLIFEEKINKSIQKLVNEEDSIDIDDNELIDIELTAKKRKLGIQTVDVGCGELTNTVTLDSLENLINTTTISNDPLTVGNSYVNIATGGFNSTNQAQANQNNETIKDGFLKRIILVIVTMLVKKITLPPQIRTIFALTSAFKNNGIPDIGDPINDIKNRRKLSNCLSKTAKSEINKFIFEIVKKEMLDIIIPVSKIIIKEKINNYVGILRSLIGI